MEGVYSITNLVTGKKYIGQSSDVEKRLSSQKCNLTSSVFRKKAVNRYLYADVQSFGWDAFDVEIVEQMPGSTTEERLLAEAFWIDIFSTTDRDCGYNLRVDTADGMMTHDETRALHVANTQGEKNPNFGNRWSEDQKSRMAEIAVERHISGEFYTDESRRKALESRQKTLKSNPEILRNMGKKISKLKQKYRFVQMTPDGQVIKVWDTVNDILQAHPDYRAPAIYGVCDGYKATHRGFAWRKELKI